MSSEETTDDTQLLKKEESKWKLKGILEFLIKVHTLNQTLEMQLFLMYKEKKKLTGSFTQGILKKSKT
jgi:hypothetical protein